MGPGQHGVLGPGADDRRQLLALRPQRTGQPGVDLRETCRALLVVHGEQRSSARVSSMQATLQAGCPDRNSRR